MTTLADQDTGKGSLRFAKDYVGVDYHNDSHTHIDALCHVSFDGLSTTAGRATPYPRRVPPWRRSRC